jgi:TolB-like protein/Flp pilus assembly protein TadD
MSEIFISYSSHDRTQALALCELLRSSGVDVWIDTNSIEGATRWSKEIVEAINRCSTIAILLSEHSLQSKNVVKEIALAAEKDKQILPILLQDVILNSDFEYHLAGLHRVRYDDSEAILRAVGQSSSASKPKVSPSGEANKLRLAVLPFDDLSPTQDNSWFADGMMNELIDTLGALSELQVVPRSDVIYYKNHKPNPSELAQDLGVQYFVEGAVQKAGNKIRIRVSLNDVINHKQLWSAKYDGNFDDIFDLQEKTAVEITEALRLKLTPDEQQRIRKKETENAEAYELHVKSIDYFRRSTREDYNHAIKLLKEAIHLDPHYAAAYTTLAHIYTEIYRTYDRDKKWIEEAEATVERAAAIDGESARVSRTRSRIAQYNNDPQEALRLAQKAVDLEPDFPLAYNLLAFAYRSLGMLKEMTDANEMDVKKDPNNLVANFSYLISLSELGDTERLRSAATKALPLFQRYVRHNPDDLHAQIQLANAYRMTGDLPQALKQVRIIEQRSDMDPHALYNLACLYVQAGDHDAGVTTLRKAIDHGFSDIETLRLDPDFNPIRESPKFQEAVKLLESKL